MRPMRMLILLAVFWAAGSLLLAAEWFLPAPKTTPAAQPTTARIAALAAAQEQAATDTATAQPAPGTEKDAGTAVARQDEPQASAPAAGEPGTDQKTVKAEESAAAKTPDSGKDAPRDTAAAAAATPAPATDGATAPKGPSPQRFVPSEQVRADFDVSFPIDI